MAVKDVISANLPVLRELRGRMGQAELAERVGISRRTLARLEAGEVNDPGVELVQQLAAALGVPLSALGDESLVLEQIALPKSACDRARTARGWRAIVAALRE